MKQHDIQDYHFNVSKDVTGSLLPKNEQPKEPLTLFEINEIRKRIQRKKFNTATEGNSPKAIPTPFEVLKEEQQSALNKTQVCDEELSKSFISCQKIKTQKPQVLKRRNTTAAQKNARY